MRFEGVEVAPEVRVEEEKGQKMEILERARVCQRRQGDKNKCRCLCGVGEKKKVVCRRFACVRGGRRGLESHTCVCVGGLTRAAVVIKSSFPYPNARLRRVRGLLSSRPLTDTKTTRLDASISFFFFFFLCLCVFLCTQTHVSSSSPPPSLLQARNARSRLALGVRGAPSALFLLYAFVTRGVCKRGSHVVCSARQNGKRCFFPSDKKTRAHHHHPHATNNEKKPRKFSKITPTFSVSNFRCSNYFGQFSSGVACSQRQTHAT